MKRFLVLHEVWYPDVENGPECDTQGHEPVADFDTEAEAQAYVDSQKFPQSYMIEDNDRDEDDGHPGSLDEGWPEDGSYLGSHRDDDDDYYDDDDDYEDEDDDEELDEDADFDDEDDMC